MTSASYLSEFRPNEDLPADFLTIIYGKRRTGKTTLMLHMLYLMRERFKNHEMFVISGTAGCNPSQWKAFPPTAVYSDVSNMNDTIQEMLDDQKALIRKAVKAQMRARMGLQNGENEGKHEDGKKDKPGSPKAHSRPDSIPSYPGIVNEVKEPETEKNDTKRDQPKKKAKVVFRHVVDSTKQKTRKNQQSYARGRIREKANQPYVFQVPDTDPMKEGEPEEEGDITQEMVDEELRKGEYDKSLMPHKLVVLDDVVDNSTLRHCPALNTLAVSGRHYFFTVFILSQCICGSGSVPPIVRINADYIICVYNPRARMERKLFQDQYLSCNNSNACDGLRLLADITRVPYRTICIDCTNVTSQRYDQYIYTFGPTPEPPAHVPKDFRVGTAEQWRKSGIHSRAPKFNKEDETKKWNKKPNEALDGGRFHGVPHLHLAPEGEKYFSSVF